jgi:hypothetical protein
MARRSRNQNVSPSGPMLRVSNGVYRFAATGRMQLAQLNVVKEERCSRR